MTDQRVAIIDFQGLCAEKDKLIQLLEHMLKREQQYSNDFKDETVEVRRMLKEKQNPEISKLDCSQFGHNQESVSTILHFLKTASMKDESGKIMELVAGLITKVAQSQLSSMPQITLKRYRDCKDPIMDKRAKSFLNKYCEITQGAGKLTSQDLELPIQEYRKKNSALFTLKNVEDVLFDDANIDEKYVKGIKEYHNIKLKVKKVKKI